MKSYFTTNCVAHRFNNILKCGFYQTSKKKLKLATTASPQQPEIMCSSGSENDNGDDEVELTAKVTGGTNCENNKAAECYKTNNDIYGSVNSSNDDAHPHVSTSCTYDYSIVKLSDIPLAALKILDTIASCKSLVRFTKKVRN